MGGLCLLRHAQPSNPRRRHPPKQTSSAPRNVGHLPLPSLPPAPLWADFVCFGTPQPPNPRRRHPPEQQVGHPKPRPSPSALFASRTPVGELRLLRHAPTFQPTPPAPAGADKFGTRNLGHLPLPSLSPAPLWADFVCFGTPNLPTHAAGTRRSRQVRQPETSAIPHPLARTLRCRTCPGSASPLPTFPTFTPAHPRQSPPTLPPVPAGADKLGNPKPRPIPHPLSRSALDVPDSEVSSARAE